MNISELKEKSYVPYSNIPTIAVVQSESGEYFGGVRIENISYPLTISAAQSALYCCLSEGYNPSTLYVELQDQDEPLLAFWKQELDIEIAALKTLKNLSLDRPVQQLNSEQVEPTLHKLLDRSVVEHSNFPVSALIETSNGFISGVNIETTDWSKGLCAERTALAKAITYGYRDLKSLHIYTRDGEYNSPCGACRQVIVEHLPHRPVNLYHNDGTRAKHFSSDLLPYNFQSSSLQNK